MAICLEWMLRDRLVQTHGLPLEGRIWTDFKVDVFLFHHLHQIRVLEDVVSMTNPLRMKACDCFFYVPAGSFSGPSDVDCSVDAQLLGFLKGLDNDWICWVVLMSVVFLPGQVNANNTLRLHPFCQLYYRVRLLGPLSVDDYDGSANNAVTSLPLRRRKPFLHSLHHSVDGKARPCQGSRCI